MSKNILGYKSISKLEKITYETTLLKINNFDDITGLRDAIRSEIIKNPNLNTLKNQCFSHANFIDIENYPWYNHYTSVFLVLTNIDRDNNSEKSYVFDSQIEFSQSIIGDNGVKLVETFKKAQGYTFLCSWNDQRFDVWDICVGTDSRKMHIATNLLTECMSFVSDMIRNYIPTTKYLFNNLFPKPHLLNTETYDFGNNKISIEVIAQKYNHPALRSLYNAGFRVNSQSFKYVDNIPALKPLYPDYINKEGKIFIHLLYEFEYFIDEKVLTQPDGSSFQGIQLTDRAINDINNTPKEEIKSEYDSLIKRLQIMESGSKELRACRMIINPDIVMLFKKFLEFPVEIGFFPDYSVEMSDRYITYTIKNVDLKTIDISSENQSFNDRAGGCVVSIGKTSGLFVFHTHPYACCGKMGYNLAMPSDADLNIITMSNILKFGGNNFSTGIISSHEGIYIYSIHKEIQANILELKENLCKIPGYNDQQFEMVILLITNTINLGGRLLMWRYIKKYSTVDERNIGLEGYLNEMKNITLNTLFTEIHNNIRLFNQTNGPIPHDGKYNYKLTPEILFKEQPALLTIFYNLLSRFNEFNANDYNIDPANGDRIKEEYIFGQNISYGDRAFRELTPDNLNSFLKYFAYTSIFIPPNTFSLEEKGTIFNIINEVYNKIINSKIWNIELYQYEDINGPIMYDFHTNHFDVKFECNSMTKEYIDKLKKDPILHTV